MRTFNAAVKVSDDAALALIATVPTTAAGVGAELNYLINEPLQIFSKPC